MRPATLDAIVLIVVILSLTPSSVIHQRVTKLNAVNGHSDLFVNLLEPRVTTLMKKLSLFLIVLSTMISTACGGDSKPDDMPKASVNAPPSDSDGIAGSGIAGDPGIAGSGTAGDPGIAGSGTAGSGGSGTAGSGGINPPQVNMASCFDVVVDLNSDPLNCGSCGYKAVNGRTCVGGKPTPAWQPISTVGAPPARARHTAVFFGGKLVVMGGTESGTATGGRCSTTTGQYSPSTDTWSSFAPLITPRCNHESVADQFKIYTFGGLSNSSSGSNVGPGFEIYDSSNASWSSIVDTVSTPAARYNFAMTWTPDAKGIFIFGGSNSTASLSSGSIFYPATSSWDDVTCTNPNCSRSGYLSAFTNDSDIVVMGGNGVTVGLKYSPSNRVWDEWPLPSSTPKVVPQRHADDGQRIFYLQSTTGCPGPTSVMTYTRGGAAWSTDNSPTPMNLSPDAAIAWSGFELIAWSGSCGMIPRLIGGRYQPPAP